MDRESLKRALVAFGASVAKRVMGVPQDAHDLDASGLEAMAEEFLASDFEEPGFRDARQELVTRPMPRLELDSLKRDSGKPPPFKGDPVSPPAKRVSAKRK